MSFKPTIFVAFRPSLYALLFSDQVDQALRQLGRIAFHDEERNLSSAELAVRLPGFDAVLTSWGTPKFTDEVLAAADKLKLIAHTAGSIKGMLPPPVFERGIVVTHAASAIAPAVADLSLALTMLLLRQVHLHDRFLKAGDWDSAHALGLGSEIAGARVGVIGAGYTGRCFIKLLRALEAEVWVYDPYLGDERAAELGVTRVDLDALLAGCPVVSVQAPSTPETHHMIGAEQLKLLQDGACFINTARSWVIDYDALLAELQTGRIWAALDVFEQEPLPADNPFRVLDNVILTPHIAGASIQARHRQGQFMVEELRRFFEGAKLLYGVTAEMLDTMA
ncbi:MAG: hydroxyacid dehydrogenase [Anaerolineae bacterium]|nr:hydroxyacid dehydrogenase [Anaerolineae bacterium]